MVVNLLKGIYKRQTLRFHMLIATSKLYIHCIENEFWAKLKIKLKRPPSGYIFQKYFWLFWPYKIGNFSNE